MGHRGRKSRFDLIEPPVLRPILAPVPRSSDRDPPKHLGEPERLIWKNATDDYELGPLALDVLTAALEAHQRAREAREVIELEGMVVTGRDGQVKSHPLLAVERDARQAFLAGIRALGVEL